MNALVAEDYDDLRHLLSKMLSEFGYTVQTASNGKQALEILETSQKHYSLLLTDFNMPVMNGFELIDAALKKNIPIDRIVVLSAVDSNEKIVSEFTQNHPHIKFVSKGSLTPSNLESILGDF